MIYEGFVFLLDFFFLCIRHINLLMVIDRSLDKSPESKKRTIQTFHQIIEVMGKFSSNYDKRLNFESLIQHLGLSASEGDSILSLLLEFQDLFKHTLREYTLRKKIVDNKLYLVTEKIPDLTYIPKRLKMNKSHINLLSDITYFFKFVKKGKGFDVVANGTELLSNIKELCDFYPFLFQRQNGLLYPSDFGLQLGELTLSYKKSNKPLDVLALNGCEVKVE